MSDTLMFINTYILSLCDQLAGVELGDHTLQDFVDNGWQNAFVIVQSEFSVDSRQLVDCGSGQNTTSDVDHLQICRSVFNKVGEYQ